MNNNSMKKDEFHRHNVHSDTEGYILYDSIHTKFGNESSGYLWEAGSDRRRCSGFLGAGGALCLHLGASYMGVFTL